jgi:hypothetical protein
MTDDLGAYRRTFRDTWSCRIATVRPDGGPYVASRWFVWLEEAVWVGTRIGDTTWDHALREPRVAVLIDQGRDWVDLAGVRVEGVADALPAEHPDLREPMSAWHEKYRSLLAGEGFERMTEAIVSMGFLRVAPSRVDAWDHRVARPPTGP